MQLAGDLIWPSYLAGESRNVDNGAVSRWDRLQPVVQLMDYYLFLQILNLALEYQDYQLLAEYGFYWCELV